MPSAVYRPSTDTGSLPATHTLLSWQTSKEKLWLHVYTSCLSILLCFSKNLANKRAQRMLPSAKLLLSAGYTENAWITMCRYLDDLWGKQTFQDTLESLFLNHTTAQDTCGEHSIFFPRIFVLLKTKVYTKECSTSKKTLPGFLMYFCRTTSTWHSAIKWLKFASEGEQQRSLGGSEYRGAHPAEV